ncbi:MAG: hypothetical protein IKT44_01685 [Clostridia bacterium]|nr:hypothetical protein [Clostridia bacterium]
MKQIFEGEVYEILPLSNGILFSYCIEVTDDRNVVVGYKMISFENGRMTDITKNVYLAAKFGNNYNSIIKHCDNYITVRSIILPSGKILLFLKNGTMKLIDTDSSVTWQGNLTYRSFVASDILIHKNSLWACFSDCNVLLRYNLSNMREELRIGGKSSPFDKPKNMYLEGDVATVCNKGSKKLTQINLETYAVLNEHEFEEEVLQYVKAANHRFVILSSGLYIL